MKQKKGIDNLMYEWYKLRHPLATLAFQFKHAIPAVKITTATKVIQSARRGLRRGQLDASVVQVEHESPHFHIKQT